MEIAIESVGMYASVAVSDEGRTLAELTWPTGRRHTPALVPMIDEACRAAGVQRDELRAVFVDVGPGAYGGIRAGMAVAKGLALALALPTVGVGRLEIEAYAHAAAAGPIVALHAAGRAQWALALYRGPASAWRELAGAALHDRDEIVALLEQQAAPGVLCGEAEELPAATLADLSASGWTLAGSAASMRRAGLLAELGWRRLRAGQAVTAAALEPVYLRDPAIGPQPPVDGEARSSGAKRKERP